MQHFFGWLLSLGFLASQLLAPLAFGLSTCWWPGASKSAEPSSQPYDYVLMEP